jgi:hypothetical protein
MMSAVGPAATRDNEGVGWRGACGDEDRQRDDGWRGR